MPGAIRFIESKDSGHCHSAELLVLGAGGNSREIAEAAQDVGWHVLGFLDDDPEKWKSIIDDLPVLGPISMAIDSDAYCVCTLATYRHPKLRQGICDKLNLDPQRWATIIHPATQVARSAKIGIGSVVLAGAFVGAGCTIGDHVILLQGACVSHDCVVGKYSTITSGTCLAGMVRVGPGAYIGMGSLVLNGLTVGSGAIVGMGAVVTRDVPDDCVVRGNPARNWNALDSRGD
jgi:sugar O-acyltransferase (sialic acid O-acetyltransferase NeuD family)